MIWIVLIISALSAFVFRALPLIVRHKKAMQNSDTKVQWFLIFASQGILGAISYEALFGRKALISLINGFGSQEIIKIPILVIAVYITIKTKSAIKGFTLASLIYFVTVMIN